MPVTAEQRRARAAWDRLEEIGRKWGVQGDNWKDCRRAKTYLGALKRTACRVYVSGLGQAFAFLNSRNDETVKQAGNDLADLVLGGMGISAPAQSQCASLIGYLRRGGLLELMCATEESLALIAWLCRYLEGFGVTADEESQAEPEQEAQNG